MKSNYFQNQKLSKQDFDILQAEESTQHGLKFRKKNLIWDNFNKCSDYWRQFYPPRMKGIVVPSDSSHQVCLTNLEKIKQQG